MKGIIVCIDCNKRVVRTGSRQLRCSKCAYQHNLENIKAHNKTPLYKQRHKARQQKIYRQKALERRTGIKCLCCGVVFDVPVRVGRVDTYCPACKQVVANAHSAQYRKENAGNMEYRRKRRESQLRYLKTEKGRRKHALWHAQEHVRQRKREYQKNYYQQKKLQKESL